MEQELTLKKIVEGGNSIFLMYQAEGCLAPVAANAAIAVFCPTTIAVIVVSMLCTASLAMTMNHRSAFASLSVEQTALLLHGADATGLKEAYGNAMMRFTRGEHSSVRRDCYIAFTYWAAPIVFQVGKYLLGFE